MKRIFMALFMWLGMSAVFAQTENFVADPKIQQIAEAYALGAVDFASGTPVGRLDWSDASVAHVETILASLHAQIATAKPSAEEVSQLARAFGSYIGEVFRRNHGATGA